MTIRKWSPVDIIFDSLMNLQKLDQWHISIEMLLGWPFVNHRGCLLTYCVILAK
jgi:hypothetical protein